MGWFTKAIGIVLSAGRRQGLLEAEVDNCNFEAALPGARSKTPKSGRTR